MKNSTTNTNAFGCDAAHNHAGKMIGHSGGEVRS